MLISSCAAFISAGRRQHQCLPSPHSSTFSGWTGPVSNPVLASQQCDLKPAAVWLSGWTAHGSSQRTRACHEAVGTWSLCKTHWHICQTCLSLHLLQAGGCSRIKHAILLSPYPRKSCTAVFQLQTVHAMSLHSDPGSLLFLVIKLSSLLPSAHDNL